MKRETIRKACSILFSLVVVGGICAALLAPAGPAAEPVGAKITAINARTGVVTAKETATGRAFEFQVKDAALLRALKVGQGVSADFKGMTVTLPSARPGAKAVQLKIMKAEPVGRPAEPVGKPQATGQPVITAKPGGVKSSSVNYSAFGSNLLAQPLNPALLLPDLVPFTTSLIATCNWNESQGETCQSECPPKEWMLPLGTKNISQRPLSGPIRIRVLKHPSGEIVRDWTVTDVAGNGNQLPGCIKKTLVWCEPGSGVTVVQENHKLVVETNAPEADKNNNTRLMYIGPVFHTELLPGSCP